MTRRPVRNRSGGAPRGSQSGLINRYLLSLMARPFCGTLLIVLPALLLERLLRLFDLIASQNVPAGSVVRMLVDLVPHYLGLALPAALFIGVYFVIARLSAGNELDAMQNAGFSLGWISRPFLLMGILGAVLGFGLYGYVQPYSRYAYRAAYSAATEGTWNATIPPGEMTRVSRNLVVTADRSSRIDGQLSHVLAYQHEPDGSEKITSARSGRIILSPDGTQLLLKLQDARQMETGTDPAAGVNTLVSRSTTKLRPFILHLTGFRSRGIDERELGLGEIWTALGHPQTVLYRHQLDGELHSRLVRSLSLAVLPLLAVPFGLTAKRARRQYGVVVGVLVLVVYFHAIQLAQSLGTAGLIDPRPALWGTFLAFVAFCLSTFRRAGLHISEGPLDRVIGMIERAIDAALRGWRGLRMRTGRA